MEAWANDELRSADFGDRRLNQRFVFLVEKMAEQSSESIPIACGGWAETKAAYRFFDNPRVTMEQVLRPHRDATYRRVQGESRVLVIQDTTQLDYTPRRHKIRGAGPLTYPNQAGFLCHVLLAIRPDRTPLGVVGAHVWARDPATFAKRGERRRRVMNEGDRWAEGYERACELARSAPESEILVVCDREADAFSLYQAAAEQDAPKAHLLVRVQYDRESHCLDAPRRKFGRPLFAVVEETEPLGKTRITIPARDGKPERKAVLTLRARRVALAAPTNEYWRHLPPVEMTVISAREESRAVRKADRVDWRLLTDLEATTFEAAERAVSDYASRWQIEVFFRTLKSGCRVEDLQLETADRLLPCLGVYLIIAWRIQCLAILHRREPDAPCTVAFSDAEWKAAWAVARREPPPKEPPTLEAMVRVVASMGGWLGRKSDAPPGAKAIWTGLQTLRAITLAWEAFGPENPRFHRKE